MPMSAVRTLVADCLHALRLYAQTPGASLIATFVLTVDIAFVSASLSLYVDLALRPNPGFEQARRIATIGQNDGETLTGIRYGLLERISAEMTSIEAAAMWRAMSTLVESDRDDTLTGMVSTEFFGGLRPRIELGRGFQAEDHAADAEPVVVLSYRFWQDQFGGSPSALGAFLRISRDPEMTYLGPPGRRGPLSPDEPAPEEDSAQFRVVGVAAETFRELPIGNGSFEPKIWVPIERAWPMFAGVPESLSTSLTSGAYIRRAPGVPTTAIANELQARYQNLGPELQLSPGTRLDAIDGVVGNANVYRNAKRQLELFLGGSVLLAIVAAANVSLFLLARAPGRRREVAIRVSVGATMKRLRRQLATEAALLVGIATTLGLLGSLWLSLYLRGLALLREADWQNVTLLDWRVLSLVGVVMLLLTLLVSLTPILGLKQRGISASSRQVAARASLAQSLAGTAQITVAGTLSGAAIAFGWHLSPLVLGDPGYEMADRYFAESNVQQFGVTSPETFSLETVRWREAIEAIPGVTAVAFGRPVPGEAPNWYARRISDPFDPSRQVEVYLGEIERPFVDLLGLRLLRGRVPEANEPAVVAVNQTLARLLWGREDIVGEVLFGDPVFLGAEGSEVVGVLEDLSFAHPSAPAEPYAFRGYANYSSVVIESDLTAAELQQALNRIETEIGIRTNSVRSLRTMHRELIAPDRARGFLTMATASVVVILAAFGFYGTQRYLVAAGRREYAIRASLGAGPRSLGRLVVRRGLLLGLPGLVASGLLAFIVVAWLRGDFISSDVSPGAITLCVIAGLSSILLSATLGPAGTAKRTRPGQLLSED
jgi:ABC-type lipoprotein release transport system permease subunit